MCVISFSFAVTKHPDYDNVQMEEFVWAYSSKLVSVPPGELLHGSNWPAWLLQHQVETLNHKQEAERTNWKRQECLNSPSPPPVTYFCQQRPKS